MACRRAPQMKGSSLGTKITEEANLGLKIGHSKALLKSEDVGQTLDLSIRGSWRELYRKIGQHDEFVNLLGYLNGAIRKYADYKKKIDDRFLHRNRKLIFVDTSQLVSAARSYWSSELLCVGIRILENLEASYQFCVRNSFPVFCQSIHLILYI
ncbi:hypothetical protein PVL29_003576 [Vitis rotundifolia]|uniref:Uncharacterized protein n=1 Tax=Vitis rotundifolia TaxID=103349 RepID=A0AA39ADH2_VITRO|nr:hypothetical protein PVL29_003576 [Vitis rotundifolia]